MLNGISRRNVSWRTWIAALSGALTLPACAGRIDLRIPQEDDALIGDDAGHPGSEAGNPPLTEPDGATPTNPQSEASVSSDAGSGNVGSDGGAAGADTIDPTSACGAPRVGEFAVTSTADVAALARGTWLNCGADPFTGHGYGFEIRADGTWQMLSTDPVEAQYHGSWVPSFDGSQASIDFGFEGIPRSASFTVVFDVTPRGLTLTDFRGVVTTVVRSGAPSACNRDRTAFHDALCDLPPFDEIVPASDDSVRSLASAIWYDCGGSMFEIPDAIGAEIRSDGRWYTLSACDGLPVRKEFLNGTWGARATPAGSVLDFAITPGSRSIAVHFFQQGNAMAAKAISPPRDATVTVVKQSR
jgi:hypothetical protein